MSRSDQRVAELRVALERLTRELRDRIDGLPDHPWVPGGMFQDGALMAALEDAETALTLGAITRQNADDQREQLRRNQLAVEAEYPFDNGGVEADQIAFYTTTTQE